jgi:hypothetical protein
MSLIAFHKFLISTAILFSLGFAVRQLSAFRATGNAWALITTILLGIVAVALGYYLIHLRDFLRLPSGGAGSGASTPGDVGGRPGNGGRPSPPPTISPTRPEGPLVQGNGHDEREQDDIRKLLKH